MKGNHLGEQDRSDKIAIWHKEYSNFLYNYAKLTEQFSSDEIRIAAAANGLKQAPAPNCAANLFSKAVKLKWIENTGLKVRSVIPSNKKNKRPLYKSLLYQGNSPKQKP